jgi:hypothetical protein
MIRGERERERRGRGREREVHWSYGRGDPLCSLQM